MSLKNKWKKLIEVFEENPKSPLKVGDADNNGVFPFFTSGGKILTHSDFLVDGENIFLSTGGYAHVKYFKGKASYSTDTWCLKVKDNNLTKYIYYQILGKIKFIDEMLFRGTGLRHLQKNEFLKMEIFLPSFSIQQKIVEILDVIQSAIEVQERIIELTKELKKSLMVEIFNSKFKNQKSKLQFKIQKWVRLKEIAEIIMGQSPPSKTYNSVGKGLPFLQGKAEFGEIFPEPKKYCTQPIKIAEAGDILFSVRAPVGDVNLSNQKYCIGRGLAAIRVDSDLINNFYLFNYLNFARNIITEFGEGSTFKAINKQLLEDLKIPYLDISEQREIADILKTIDQKIEIEEKKKTLYEELFRSMLDKIMKQEIDVEKIKI